MLRSNYPLLLDKCQGKTNYLFDNHFMENKYWKNIEIFSKAKDSFYIIVIYHYEYHSAAFQFIPND